jgi:hypothetical protein
LHCLNNKNIILGMALVTGSTASAQEQLSNVETLKLLEAFVAIAAPASHTSVLGVSGGSVAPAGLGFVSLTGTTTDTDGGNGTFDGSAAFGFGAGSIAGISTQVTASITSLTDNFGDSGSLGVKFGRSIPTSGSDLSFGLAISGLAGWGDSRRAGVKTTAAVSSRDVVYLENGGRISYAWSLGLGDKVAEGDNLGAFGGVSVGINPQFGLSAAYDGRGFDLGASYLVPDVPGLNVTVLANDVLGQDTASGVTVSLAYSFTAFKN